MKRSAANPALWLVIGLPTLAVIASLTTVAIATLSPEHELPEQYHWEGAQLERDYARAARAAALGVRAELEAAADSGVCRLGLTMAGAAPPSLELRLIHATRPELDRQLQLQRTAEHAAGTVHYLAPCRPLPAARWRLELVPADGEWSVRSQAQGTLARVTIAAGVPGP